MFLKDIEEEFIHKGLHGIYVNIFKVFLILHADDIVVFANSNTHNLNIYRYKTMERS